MQTPQRIVRLSNELSSNDQKKKFFVEALPVSGALQFKLFTYTYHRVYVIITVTNNANRAGLFGHCIHHQTKFVMGDSL